MKKLVIIPAIFMMVALFTCSAFASDAIKIGVVNFQKIMKESSAGKVMDKELTDKGKELQEKLQAQNKEFENMKVALAREALVLSDEKKLERKRELDDKESDLKRKAGDYRQDLRILQNKYFSQLQKDTFTIANKIGMAQGYTLIIEQKTAGVIFAADKVDITDEVIKEYNSTYAKKK